MVRDSLDHFKRIMVMVQGGFLTITMDVEESAQRILVFL